MITYTQDRFREISLEYILSKIRESKLYDFQEHPRRAAIFINGRYPNQVQLWDGRLVKGFPHHIVYIGRTKPTWLNVTGSEWVDGDVVLEELSKLFGVKPSGRVVIGRYDSDNFNVNYDVLRPEKEFPLEKITLSVSKYVLKPNIELP